MKIVNWQRRVANWKLSRGQQRPLEFHLLHAHEEITEMFGKIREGWGYDAIATDINSGKPDGFGIELADAILTLLYIAEMCGLDAEKLMEIKMTYNEQRRGKQAKVE